MQSVLSSIVVLSLSLALSSGHADENSSGVQPAGDSVLRSEYLHQAPGGIFELIPQIRLGGDHVRERVGDLKYNSVQTFFGADVEYGLNSIFSIGGGLYYGFGATSIEDCPVNTTCKGTTGKGLQDPSVILKGTVPMNQGALRFGLVASTAIEDHKISSNSDYNFASGGTLIRGMAGYEHILSQQVLGGSVYYDLFQGDRKVTDKSSGSTVNSKITNGNGWGVSAFYEYHLRMVTIGGALGFDKAPGTGSVTAGVNSNTNDESQTWSFKVYSPVRFSEKITLLPSISYGRVDFGSSKYSLRDGSGFELACAGRFSF